MLGWLFVTVLGIIWAVFLLPFLRRGGSPVTSVEEFERKMEFLAETNRGPRGRWVLTPRKDSRFLRPRDRHRSRVVRRRRRILAGLAEAATLAMLIGLFPPFHGLLVAAGTLGAMLLVYTTLLVRVRVREDRRARIRRARARRARAMEGRPVRDRARVAVEAPIRAPAAEVRAGADGYGFDGYGAGWAGYPTGQVAGGPRAPVGPDDELRVVIDDDVHLVVRRPQSVVLGELDELDAASR